MRSILLSITMRQGFISPRVFALTLLLSLGLAGCAGVGAFAPLPATSTEAEVRTRWGEPGRVWPALAGAPASNKALEYSRQPSGHTAYMIDIGADGKVLAVRQVLNRENFARVVVGMTPEEVLRLLGQPMKITLYPLKPVTYYDWRYLDGLSRENSAVFSAVYDASMRVISTVSVRDLDVNPDPRIGLFAPKAQRQWRV